MDVYSLVTDKILAQLEKGVVPWQRPWHSAGQDLPYNGVTGRRYSGINVFLLTMSGYNDPRWLTFNQAKQSGGKIRKGEHGQTIVFWSQVNGKADENGERKPIWLLRYYTVFNASQVEDVAKLKPLPVVDTSTTTVQPIDEAETIVQAMHNRPRISYGGESAYYIPSEDSLHMPSVETFIDSGSYYATLFHELAHSTGHPSRLDRHGFDDLLGAFGSAPYSKEELVAEFASAFVCAEAGISNVLDNSASYIQSWMNARSNDNRMLVWAASRAQAAADYILNRVEKEVDTIEEAA